MVLPGLGQEEPGADPAKPFKLEDFRLGLPTKVRSIDIETDDLEELETYSIAESAFLDCLQIDQVGIERAPLPPALTPRLGLKFRTFDARLEAKYGVRNYIREIASLYAEIDTKIADQIPHIVGVRKPLGPAIAMVRMFNEVHAFDVQVRQLKRAGRQQVYFRSLEPRRCHARVIRSDLEEFDVQLDYEEDLIVLAQREVVLGNNLAEMLWALQPVAITYHALLRLWDRGHADGKTFHTLVADAFKRLRGVTALVEVCHLALGRDDFPSAIAVPVLDGFLVASSRHVMTGSDDLRWGVKRRRGWRGRLQFPDNDHFPLEGHGEVHGMQYTFRRDWFAATFMGANDVGDLDRVLAANRFSLLLDELNLDEIARYREWLTRWKGERPALEISTSFPDPQKVVDLQCELLPRVDAPDCRWHVLNF